MRAILVITFLHIWSNIKLSYTQWVCVGGLFTALVYANYECQVTMQGGKQSSSRSIAALLIKFHLILKKFLGNKILHACLPLKSFQDDFLKFLYITTCCSIYLHVLVFNNMFAYIPVSYSIFALVKVFFCMFQYFPPCSNNSQMFQYFPSCSNTSLNVPVFSCMFLYFHTCSSFSLCALRISGSFTITEAGRQKQEVLFLLNSIL